MLLTAVPPGRVIASKAVQGTLNDKSRSTAADQRTTKVEVLHVLMGLLRWSLLACSGGMKDEHQQIYPEQHDLLQYISLYVLRCVLRAAPSRSGRPVASGGLRSPPGIQRIGLRSKLKLCAGIHSFIAPLIS